MLPRRQSQWRRRKRSRCWSGGPRATLPAVMLMSHPGVSHTPWRRWVGGVVFVWPGVERMDLFVMEETQVMSSSPFLQKTHHMPHTHTHTHTSHTHHTHTHTPHTHHTHTHITHTLYTHTHTSHTHHIHTCTYHTHTNHTHHTHIHTHHIHTRTVSQSIQGTFGWKCNTTKAGSRIRGKPRRTQAFLIHPMYFLF